MAYPTITLPQRVNLMDHPAYNSWSYREKLAMPEVRSAIAKFSVAAVGLSLFFVLYFSLSACIMLAIPIFHTQQHLLLHEHLQEQYILHQQQQLGQIEELLKQATGCSPAPAQGMVILKCTETDFSVATHAATTVFSVDLHTSPNESISRTLAQLTEQHPHTRWLLFHILDCQDDEGWCRSSIAATLNHVTGNPLLVCGGSWLSGTLTLLALLLTYGPAPRYYHVMRSHLKQHSAEGVLFGTMSTRQQEAFMRDLASTDHLATPPRKRLQQPTFPSHHQSWTEQDVQKEVNAANEYDDFQREGVESKDENEADADAAATESDDGTNRELRQRSFFSIDAGSNARQSRAAALL